MPLLRRPHKEAEGSLGIPHKDGGGPDDPSVGLDPFLSHPETRFRRRATLERLVGLGRPKKPKGVYGVGDGDGIMGRVRRRSEDFGVLLRIPGRRKGSVEPIGDKGGSKRGSLLRMVVGNKGKKDGNGTGIGIGTGDGDNGMEPDRDGERGEGRDRSQQLSVLEILELIQRRELVAADEQIIALEAECAALPSSPPPSSSSLSPPLSPPLSPSPSSRQARDVSLLYDALLSQLWAVVAESVPLGRPSPLLRSVVQVLEQEEAADARTLIGTHGTPIGTHGTPTGSHGTLIGTHGTPIGTHGTPTGTHGTPIGTHGTLIGTHGTPIGTHGTPTGSHGTPIGTHGTPIGTHGTPIGTHGTPIGAHGTPIGTHRTPIGRPRGLRRRWEEAVGRAAHERLGQVVVGGGLGPRLAALAGRVIGDLGSVRSHVAPLYPAPYDAFGVYARGYHRALAQHVAALAQRTTAVPELYLLLDWNCNTYPREVLGHPDIGAQLQAQALGPLLPPETQRGLERACIDAVKCKVELAVAQELQLSEDTWAEEVTAEDMQGGLAARVTGLLRAHMDRAPQISPEFGLEMAHSLLGVMVTFLHSFQRKVERFLEAPSDAPPPDGVSSRAIAISNCCPTFRSFVDRLSQFPHPDMDERRRQTQAALDKVTRLCNNVLTRPLMDGLKPYFQKLLKRRWLSSSDAFDSIVMNITSFSHSLKPLQPQPYQVLVSELHRRVLQEYVRPLLQCRIVCTSSKMRGRVAARIGDEARQLRELFCRLDSSWHWLDSVLPRLQELLVLEDVAALQMEVGVLARDFPDVRRKHVAALLDLRGLRSPAARQEILGVLQDVGLGDTEGGGGPPRERAFFAELPVARRPRCLPFDLQRLARLRIRGLRPEGPNEGRL